MKSLSFSSVKKWQLRNGVSVPTSVSTVCPFCNALATFTLADHHPGHSSFTARSTCPACDKEPIFIIIEPTDCKRKGELPAELCMYPEGRSWHSAEHLVGEIPDWLSEAFSSAVDSYNARIYTATAVCARRTLEGLFKHAVAEDKKGMPLAKLIEEVGKSTDLAKPLNELARALKDGGNLGAHFDAQKSPDAVMAKHMVELLEYLISYLYILPKRIGELEKAMDQ